MNPLEVPEPAQVVRIFAAVQEPDYEVPWQTESPSDGTGSGVIIGPDRVLTGAHVVADATFVQVQTVFDSDKVVATVEAICHDSDLALLRISDPAAFEGIEPAQIGGLPNRRAHVAVVGFPVGGEELSITEGVVSRIEVQRYTHSQRFLLAITVDAAINDGNSGGPVLQDGRVIGIAFQSLQDAENIGEAVPAALIRRFLAGVETGQSLDIPGLGLSLQNLENPTLRKHLGVPSGSSGQLVTAVEYGGSCWDLLAPGDVLHEIDGHRIANNGTVQHHGRFRTKLPVVLGERFIGDEIPIQFSRDGKLIEAAMKLRGAQYLVPRNRYDVAPTYFVHGGIVFEPLTRNFLCTWEDFYQNAPKEFLAHYYLGHRTEERQEIVVISKVLADDLTVGYGPLYWESIERVNGVIPRDIRHFIRQVEAAEQSLHIETSRGGRLVFDVAEVRAAKARILARYQIPADRSVDLR